MSCNRLEPIPTVYHKPRDVLYSPGFSCAYVIRSYPVCRLYYDDSEGAKFPLQPHGMEYRANKNKTEGNYLSYLVSVLGSSAEFYITDQFLKVGCNLQLQNNLGLGLDI